MGSKITLLCSLLMLAVTALVAEEIPSHAAGRRPAEPLTLEVTFQKVPPEAEGWTVVCRVTNHSPQPIEHWYTYSRGIYVELLDGTQARVPLTREGQVRLGPRAGDWINASLKKGRIEPGQSAELVFKLQEFFDVSKATPASLAVTWTKGSRMVPAGTHPAGRKENVDAPRENLPLKLSVTVPIPAP